jgi:hypothetical protein
MAASTGPIVTLGLITWGNGVILQSPPAEVVPFSARVAVGTGIAAGGLALLERTTPDLAKAVAWLALITVLFARLGGRRAPVENLLRWYNDES